MQIRLWIPLAVLFSAVACGSGGGATPPKGDPDIVDGIGGGGGEGPGPGGQDCAPGTSGPDCQKCKAGAYCPGGESPEVSCKSGTFDDDKNPATPCRAWSVCEAGTFAKDGTSLLDRVCESCDSGTFSSGTNAKVCTPKTNCAAGTFVEKEGTSSEDRFCSACAPGTYSTKENASTCTKFTTCVPGEFITTPGTVTQDQACAPCAAGELSSTENAAQCVAAGSCAPGTVQTAPATASTPAVCEACSVGEFCAGGDSAKVLCATGTWDHDANPATACLPRTTCLAGEFIASEGNAITDRVCENCNGDSFSSQENSASCQPMTVCPAGQFVTSVGTPSADRVCGSCGVGTFSSAENSGSCLPWSDCAAGQAVSTEGTSTNDRSCANCSNGTYSTELNESSCRAWTDCSAGEFVVIDPSSTVDRVCSACASGTFSIGVNESSCLSHSDCAAGTYVTNVPNETTDRTCSACPNGTYSDQTNLSVCLPIGECAAGTLEITPGSPTQAPVCQACEVGTYCAGAQAPKVPCAPNTFDDDWNPATACIFKTSCIAGERVASVGSETQDRTCATCDDGTYSTTENANVCVAWSTCGAGERVALPGTASSNRVCEACTSGTFSTSPNSPVCVPFSDCALGEYEVAAGSATSNRVCDGCASGSFSTIPNAASCVGWSDCPAGSFVSEAPSSQKDRVCSPCGAGTYTNAPNLSVCLDQGSCAAGTVQVSPGTATEPPTCSPCPAGTFCAGGTTPAVNCGAGTWDHDQASATACVPRSTCIAGQFVTGEGDAQNDRTCSPCGSGSYSVSNNALTCAPWSDCAPGSYVSQPGTSSADRVCSLCPSGAISFSANAGSCEPIVAKAVAAGGSHTCAILTDGSLRCFGQNTYGQLGYGNTTQIGDTETPSAAGAVSVGGTVVQVTAGTEHTCVLLSNGTVRCFGRNNYGQLGIGNTNSIGDNELPSSWVTVSLGGTATAIAAGATHTCAVLSGGTVRCWGRNNAGQLGYGNVIQIGDNELPSSVGLVQVGEAVTALALGTEFSCALLSSGNVKCWGRNNFGQLGQSSVTTIGDDELPSSVGSIPLGTTATAIAAGATHACAVLSGGTLRCWGRSNYGQLGYGNTQSIGDNESPSSVGTVDVGGTVTGVSAGASHTCAVLSGGTLRCFGRSNVGQLGYGNTQSVGDNEVPSFVSPVSVGALLSSVATFNEHTCGLTVDGGLRCWGRNTNGQLGLANVTTIGDNELPSSQPLLSLF